MASLFTERPMPDFKENFGGERDRTDRKIDLVWLGVTMALVIFGIVMVYSASSQLAARRYHNSFYFAQKQMAFAFFGFLVMIVFRFIPYQKFQKWGFWLMVGTLLSLILVLIPGIGSRMGGASRWFRLGGVSFQPAEFSKLVLVIFLAWSMKQNHDQMQDLFKGFLFHWGIVGVFIVLILLEPDLGMVITLALITGIMLFVGGVRIKHLILSIIPIIPLAYLLVWRLLTAG